MPRACRAAVLTGVTPVEYILEGEEPGVPGRSEPERRRPGNANTRRATGGAREDLTLPVNGFKPTGTFDETLCQKVRAGSNRVDTFARNVVAGSLKPRLPEISGGRTR